MQKTVGKELSRRADGPLRYYLRNARMPDLAEHKVSVLIPLYNSAPYIVATLDSLCRQSHDNWEAILVDDGSTDETAQKLAPYLSDARFKYVKQSNQGVAGARNTGIKTATGRWVCLLDHDDRWLPTKLEQQLQFAVALDCDIVCTDALIVNGHSRERYSRKFFSGLVEQLKQSADAGGVDVFGLLIHGNFLCASSVMLKRSLFDKAGLLDVQAAPADDYDFWLRCMPEAKFGYLDEPLIEYVLHEQNCSHNVVRMYDRIIFVLSKAQRAHRHNSHRVGQFNQALLNCYQQLFDALLAQRAYLLMLRRTLSLCLKGRAGVRTFINATRSRLLITRALYHLRLRLSAPKAG
jgi:glycosyltransferase involved in cell wall biosynthesis